MCGIAGIISKNKLTKQNNRINNMLDSMRYRGPDNKSFVNYNEYISFGHDRLSIIDLCDDSNQPMISNNGRWIISYNGEIYNYKEIREEINYDYKTNGDTEVILASVQEKGIDWFLKRANGMFSIALYDTIEKNIYLIRDRFSIKPLFYYKKNNILVFASEIKGILNSGLVDVEFNEGAIDDYLGNRVVREPFTFFSDIYQVCGGCYIVFDKDLNKKEIKYYELPRQNFEKNYDEEELLNELKTEVENAINRWTISDVKVGAYLSGGVDSSLTSAIIASKCSDASNLHTYTIGFKEENEFEFSKIVADKYGINHKNILIDYDDYIKRWEELIYYNDAPLAVPNEIPLAIMSTELSKDITVVISGEGADELFGGYGRIYRLPFDYENHKNGKSFYDTFIDQYEYVPRVFRDKYLNSNKDIRNYFDTKLKSDFSKYSNEENIFRFFQTIHIKGLLKRVDMTTMQASVEARPPFLDHELIEFVNTKIPYDLKLKWKSKEDLEIARTERANDYSEIRDIPKYALKKVAEYYLPNEIIYRKKVGFPVPLSSWFSNFESFVDKYLKNATWLKTEYLDELIEDTKNNKKSGQILWMFLNIEMFRQKYFEKNWRY